MILAYVDSILQHQHTSITSLHFPSQTGEGLQQLFTFTSSSIQPQIHVKNIIQLFNPGFTPLKEVFKEPRHFKYLNPIDTKTSKQPSMIVVIKYLSQQWTS